jgi:hypothetical protein
MFWVVVYDSVQSRRIDAQSSRKAAGCSFGIFFALFLNDSPRSRDTKPTSKHVAKSRH